MQADFLAGEAFELAAAKESGATTEAEIKAKSSEILRELALQLAKYD